MATLQNKTLFITGASRGIGKAIALRAARDGANIVVAAKTTEPHPKLPGTIYMTAEEIERAGGRALPVAVDVRDEAQLENAVRRAVETFGGIDVLVNNASAISLTSTLETPMKRFDLMHQVNTRGTFLCTQKCLPHLMRAQNAHVLNIAPPLNMHARWFARHVAYTIAKYGMSMCVLGMAEELRSDGIAVNALWPRTAIDTAAIAFIAGRLRALGADEARNGEPRRSSTDSGSESGPETRRRCRKPEIMADAAHVILTRPSRTCTGNFFIDDEVLRDAGVSDFAQYRHEGISESDLMGDLFL